ncbi:MAG TPA: response regulator, partial [Verrucomicrobiae bacterium]
MKSPLTILHIEDVPYDSELVFERLGREGIIADIHRIQTREQLIAALERGGFDIILADFKLPTFDGLAALTIVRERNPDIPFIFLSGTMGEVTAIESLKAGATDYVLKNRLDRLTPAIARALREAKERRQRRVYEETVREQAAWLELTTDAIVVRDLDERIRFCNKGAQQLYGFAATNTPSPATAYQDIIQEQTAFAHARKTLLEKGEWKGEFNIRSQAGQSAIVSSHWTLLRDAAQQPNSILTIDSDITEKRRMESLFIRGQRMESIGRLASGIAHDLNNILAPILISVPMLRWGLSPEETEKMLGTIEGSARRGADLVKQLLTLSQGIEGEKMLLKPRLLLQDMEKMIRQTFPKNITVSSVVAKDLWNVRGDSSQLNQVLLNLCVNARDAMASGGTLTLSAQNAQLDESYA